MNRLTLMKQRPKPDVETLKTSPAYRLVLELGYQEIVPFVMTQIRKRGLFPFLYAFINLATFLLIILFTVNGLRGQTLSWTSLLLQSLTGIAAGSILIIPVHELLHGLAYRLIGARKIIFGWDPGQLIFYVTANRYPVSGMQVHLLTLTPFIIINLSTVLLTALAFPGGFLFSAVFLISHNTMCIGDFAISGFVSRTEGKVYTYDEPELKKSYFYAELRS